MMMWKLDITVGPIPALNAINVHFSIEMCPREQTRVFGTGQNYYDTCTELWTGRILA